MCHCPALHLLPLAGGAHAPFSPPPAGRGPPPAGGGEGGSARPRPPRARGPPVGRPAPLVGPAFDPITPRHFEAPRLLTLRGTSPAWTFCHAEDLGSALVTVVHEPVPDEVTVSAWGALTQAEVEEISGMRRIELSVPAAQAAADRLHRLGVIPVPATDLAYVMYPWATEPDALAAHGWYPAYDNAACLSVLLEGVRGHHAVMARRVRSRDAVGAAAAGAASAAVAVIATAALMRRRRSRD